MRTLVLLVSLVAITFAEEQVVGKPILHGLLCLPCKDLVQSVEHKGEEELETFLRKEVKHVCHHLGAFDAICENELDKLVEEMIPLIEKKLSPEEVCEEVKCC